MNPTAEQLANRLNPTPVTFNLPTTEGLFTGVGSVPGGTLYRRVGNRIETFDLTNSLLTEAERRSAGNYGNSAGLAMQRLKEQYGLDYSSLPQINLGDLSSQGHNQGLEVFRKAGPEGGPDNFFFQGGNDLTSFLGAKQNVNTSPVTVNNTPNAIATPDQIKTQMQNPLWNTGAGKPLPGLEATPGQTPVPQPLAAAGANPLATPGALPGVTTPTATALPTPDVILQPGNTGNDVKKLQDFLVAQGLMTQAQVNTGYGIYGPQTTAAVNALQQKLGIDNSSGPGFFGPKTIEALKALNASNTQTQPGAQAPTDMSGATTANTGTPIPPSTANGKTPLQNTIDTYTEIYKQLGIGTIKEQYEKTLKEQEEMTNKMNDEIAEINDDPWLSQGVRDARTRKVQSRYETKLNTLSNYAKLYDSLYQEGIQQTQFLAGQVQTDTNKAMELAQRKQEALDGLANDNEIIDVNGRQVLVNKSTGKKIADLGASKVTGTGTGNNNQITDNERALFGQFRNEPIVKDYNTILSKKLTVDNIIKSGVGGPGDLAIVYEFMKGLDPTSVVRETEYASAAKSGNIFAGALAKFNGYFKETGGFLPESVKQSFQSIVNSKLDVQTQLYNNLANEYKSIAERQGLNPLNVIANYSGGATTAPVNTLPVVLAKGALSDRAFVDQALTKAKLNYTTIVNNTPAGQIPVLDNKTGQPGYITPGEFTSNLYTKL